MKLHASALVAILMLTTGCLASSLDDLNSAAIKAYRAGNYSEAEKLYLQAINAANDDAEYLKTLKSNLALVYTKQGRLDEAKKYETTVTERKPLINEKSVGSLNTFARNSREKFEALLPVDPHDMGIDTMKLIAICQQTLPREFPQAKLIGGGKIGGFKDRQGRRYLFFPFKISDSNNLIQKEIQYRFIIGQSGEILSQSVLEGIAQTTEHCKKLEQAARALDEEQEAYQESQRRQEYETKAAAEKAAADKRNSIYKRQLNDSEPRTYSSSDTGKKSGQFGDGNSWSTYYNK